MTRDVCVRLFPGFVSLTYPPFFFCFQHFPASLSFLFSSLVAIMLSRRLISTGLRATRTRSVPCLHARRALSLTARQKKEPAAAST